MSDTGPARHRQSTVDDKDSTEDGRPEVPSQGGPVEPPVATVHWYPAGDGLEVVFAAHRAEPAEVVFTSPIWLEFAEDSLLSVKLLTVPDLLAGLGEVAGADPDTLVSYDTGWLWIQLRPGPVTRRRRFDGRAELLLDGRTLAGLRLLADRP